MHIDASRLKWKEWGLLEDLRKCYKIGCKNHILLPNKKKCTDTEFDDVSEQSTVDLQVLQVYTNIDDDELPSDAERCWAYSWNVS